MSSDQSTETGSADKPIAFIHINNVAIPIMDEKIVLSPCIASGEAGDMKPTSSASSSCSHPNWKFVVTKGYPEADGIEDPQEAEYQCKDCDKVLAKGYRCISATWYKSY